MTCVLLCLCYSLFVVELSFLSTVANYLLQSIIYFYSVHQPGPILLCFHGISYHYSYTALCTSCPYYFTPHLGGLWTCCILPT